MFHDNPKSPLKVNKPESSSIKFATPEIRVGLDSAKASSPKMPKDKNVILPKIKKMPKRKLAY